MLSQLLVEPNVKSSLLLMGCSEIRINVCLVAIFLFSRTTVLLTVPTVDTAGLSFSLRSQH